MGEATEIILDPKGNHHRDGRHWLTNQRSFLRRLAPAEVTLVDGPEEAAEVARQSAMRGYRKIVSVGCDRTAHGVLNGLMTLADHHRRQIKAGFLSFSKSDHFSRTLGLPIGLESQLEILCAGHTLPLDVGRMDGLALDSTKLTRHFLSGAAIGFTGRLRREWRDPDANLLDTLPRLADALRGTHPNRAPRVRLDYLGSLLYEGPMSMAWIMGGRYAPGFGAIAPQADLGDGQFELGWLPAASLPRLALQLARLRFPALLRKGGRLNGRLNGGLDWYEVDQVRASLVGDAWHSGPVEVELDGQPTGRLPATFSVMRRALPIMVAQVAVKLHKPKAIPIKKIRNGQLAGNLKIASGL